MAEDGEGRAWRRGRRWRVAIGAFVVQLFIPSVFAAYGILLEVLLRNQASEAMLWRGLFPPVLHSTTRSFMDPVFSAAFSGQSAKTKGIVMLGVLLMAASVALNMLTDIECLQIFTFGIVGGLSTSIVTAQTDAVLFCHFPAHRGPTQVLNHLALAFGHFAIPLLAHALVVSYGLRGGLWLYSGTVLQGLVGASFLSPPTEKLSAMQPSNRPRSHTIQDVELREFSTNELGHSGRSPLLTRDRSWKNPALASDSRFDIPQTMVSGPPSRHRTTTGVDILPEIPEESEESDDDSGPEDVGPWGSDADGFARRETPLPVDALREPTMADCNASERLCSRSLQKWRHAVLESETNATVDVREDFEQISFYPDASDLHTLTSSASDILRPRRLDCDCSCTPLRRVQCSCCSNACMYDAFIAVINVPNTVTSFVIEPMLAALRLPFFLPAVVFHAVALLCPLLFVTFVPTLNRRQLRSQSSQDGAFSISIAAFASLCFLLFSPYILQSRAKTKKVVYFIGSTFLATGLYIVSTTRSHSVFALGCTFFGLGHGATLGTSPSVLEDALGSRNFVRVQGPLGFLSGCFILFSSILLGFILREENGLNKCFVALSAFQTVTNIFLLLSYFKMCLKSRWTHLHHMSSAEWQPTGSFLTPD